MAGRWVILSTTALVVAVGTALLIGVATSGSGSAVASLDDLRDQGVLFLEDHHVFVVYNDGEPLALSDDAQHLGDRVEFCSSSQLFESPAHGEKFDLRGYYLSGPARRGLDRYPIRIEGDALYVDVDQPIQGPERGEGSAREPQGRLCVPE